jgi:DNA polymerase-3 subunit delta
MTINELYKDIKAKKLQPVYLLHGDEPYFIDRAVRFFEQEILTEAERSFNLTVFYGKDSKAQDIIDTCRRYPMFSEYQVVIVKEANQLRDFEKLEYYMEHIVPSTILVLAHKQGKYDARRKVFKLIDRQGIVFESLKLTEKDLPAFLDKLLKEKKLSIDGKASQILIDSIGNNLAAMMNELDKLSLNLPEGTKVTPAHIEEYVGISKDFNVFELQNALLEKDMKRAFTIMHYMQANPKANPLIVTLSNIHSIYVKLYLYLPERPGSGWSHWKSHGIHMSSIDAFNKAKRLYSAAEVEHIFTLLLEYDLRSKGVFNGETDDTGLLTELIYKLCSGKNALHGV